MLFQPQGTGRLPFLVIEPIQPFRVSVKLAVGFSSPQRLMGQSVIDTNQEDRSLLTDAEFIRIYREHTIPLYRFVSHRVGGDRALAEDIVQETWLRAIATWPRRGVADQPQAWLVRVARNLLASHFRALRPQSVDPLKLNLEDDRLTPQTPDQAALVGWGMARLRRHQAEILEWFYFDGKSTSEIASELGLSERAVEGRLRRARQKLKRHIKPYVIDVTDSRAVPSVPRMTALKMMQGGEKNDESS